MKAAVLTLALLAAPSFAADPPFEFQGVALDTKYSDISSMFKAGQCGEGDSEIVCTVSGAKVLDAPASLEYHFEKIDAKKRLYRIEVYLLNDAAASKALSGLTQKWGEPEPDFRGFVWRKGAYRITLIQVAGGSAITYLNRDVKDVIDKKLAVKAASGL